MAVTAAALVPHPPLLVPELGRGASPELDELRSACRRALAATLEQADALLVVGAAPSWGEAQPGAAASFAPYGAAVEVALPRAGPRGRPDHVLDRGRLPPGHLDELPLSLAVAAWLLSLEGAARQLPSVAAFGVPASLGSGRAVALGRALAGAVRAGRRAGLLVMGDLSARRTPRAPAALHPGAAAFDQQVGDAIRKAEPARLLDLDAEAAAELRVGGTAPLWLLAGAVEGAGALRGEVLYEAAPYGVGYLVGVLTLR